MRLSRSIASAVLIATFLHPTEARSAWLTNGTPVCLAPGNQGQPAVVHDGNGGALIVWHDLRSGSRIYARHLDGNGNGVAGWPADGVPVQSVFSASDPIAVSDGAGGAIAVWKDSRGGLYAQRMNGAGTMQWTANGAPVGLGVISRFQAVEDRAGGVLIAWDDATAGAGDPNIRAQHLNSSGDRLWGNDGVAVCSAAAQQTGPAIVTDFTGGAIVAWVDARNGMSQKRVFAQRVSAQGVPQWTADGVVVGGLEDVSDQFSVRACVDGLGGAYAIWGETRQTGLGPILGGYLQRISPSGTPAPGWNPSGLYLPYDPLHDGEALIANPTIVADQSHGCIVTHSSIYGTYLRGVSPAGQFQWGERHITFYTSVGGDPALAADGMGGCFLGYSRDNNLNPTMTWYGLVLVRQSPGGYFVYRDDISAGMVGVWNDVSIAGTKPTAGIVAWADSRNLINSDIYAARVGSTGPVDVGPAASTALAIAAHPNPVHIALTARFALEREGPASLAVIDLAGRVRFTRDVSAFGPGAHSLTLDGTRALEPGVYFLALRRAGTATQTLRFAVVR